ncbi:MAG: PhzF family phenazine biosynthesis protein [Defluviitaleaceae bacterium]|nr:PhzF family phenazine biosynthesis protein [Defluviitaleaceae bacterium]MCL2240748.1 PhzF family phenazine biosynthesis protein [Defluviitaleaceae bacterium]
MEYHVIHAFTDTLFSGNPAGVCLPEGWPSDAAMQKIAAENNLSETAFVVKRGKGRYGLRWFTPTVEVDLCGHATLSAAYVLFDGREKDAHELIFHTASGALTVTKNGGLLCLHFPTKAVEECPAYPSIGKALGVTPLAVYTAGDFMVLVETEEILRALRPDFSRFDAIREEAGRENNLFGVIVTAPGTDCDFVSRYFAPGEGIPEDPVTGSAHCLLAPFWGKRLGKETMKARQVSPRGGLLHCEVCETQVKISGHAIRYLRGEIISAPCP